MSKKPTGYVGSVTIQAEAGGIEHHQVQFPEAKADIERLVIVSYEQSIGPVTREQFGITGFEPTPDENDLDCLVRSTKGDWQMDLVEIVPAKFGRSGHDSPPGTPAVFNCGEMSDRIVELIRSKSEKYAGIVPIPWLLMYATAWQFQPSNHELTVVRHSLITNPPAQLGRVDFLRLSSTDKGEISTLYPLDDATREYVLKQDIGTLRAGFTVSADLRSGGIVLKAGKRAAVFPLGRLRDFFPKTR